MIIDSRTWTPTFVFHETGCPMCGNPVPDDPDHANRRYCSKACRLHYWREGRPWSAFLKECRGAKVRPRRQLRKRLGLERGDERFDGIAKQLAEADKIVLYVRKDGTAGEWQMRR